MTTRWLVMTASLLVLAACSGTNAERSSTPTARATSPASPSGVRSPIPSEPVSTLGRRVTAIVRLGGSPDWQAPAFGALWVANGPLGIVQRIDAKTNRVVAAVKLGESGVPCAGMAAGFGSLWVPDCRNGVVDRVDPSTDEVIARIHSGIADNEGYIAVGAGSVWVVSAPNSLTRIDPSTNRVDAQISVPDGSVAVEFGFGSDWVSDNTTSTVTRVDASTNRATATIDVGRSPRFLAAGEGAVWVLNQGDGSVSRIEPADNQVRQIETGSLGEGGCIDTGLGAVWVTIPDIPFTRIDAKTGAVTDQFHGSGGDCLSVGYGSVWLSNLDFGNVWRIKPPP